MNNELIERIDAGISALNDDMEIIEACVENPDVAIQLQAIGILRDCKAALTQQQEAAIRVGQRLQRYLAGDCVCPPCDEGVERPGHYPGCPEVYKRRIAELEARQQEAEPVSKAATYYAISSGDHVQFDTNTGQLEIYETEEEAMFNCSISLGVIAVDVRRRPPKPAAQPGSVATRDRVIDAVAGALGDAYDCCRVWEAWSYGTMRQDDFELVSNDINRLSEIADAAIGAMAALPQVQDGLIAAAEHIEKKAQDYVDDCGSYDRETGATEFPDGGEYVNTLEELAEEIRALSAEKEGS